MRTLTRKTPMPPRTKPLRKQKLNWKHNAARMDVWRREVDALHGTRCLLNPLSKDSCFGPIQRHHILSIGSHPHLKYEPLNGVPACARCHSKAHHRPAIWREWILANVLTAEQRVELERLAAVKR